MIIDLKYHIASLVAIFLALALGILVGSTMIGSDIIADQQKEIVSKLEDDFGKLRAENMKLHSELRLMGSKLALDKEFQQTTLPMLLNQRLLGKRLAIVETNSHYFQTDWEEQLINNLQKAGANICSVISLPEDLGLKDPEKKKKITKEFGWEPRGEQLFSLLANNLAQEIVGSKERQYLPLLEKGGIVKSAIETGENPTDIIVIGGGSKQKTLDKLMIIQWKKLGVRVIGVEPYTTSNSSTGFYQKLGLSTVDNVDTVPGQVSLVWLLERNKEGHYGVKSTAEQLLPDLLTN